MQQDNKTLKVLAIDLLQGESQKVFNRMPGESYSDLPSAQVGRTSFYYDAGLTGGQVYYYRACSRDPAGNLHQLSAEVGAVPWARAENLFLPLILKLVH